MRAVKNKAQVWVLGLCKSFAGSYPSSCWALTRIGEAMILISDRFLGEATGMQSRVGTERNRIIMLMQNSCVIAMQSIFE